jgi:hypothetical protein
MAICPLCEHVQEQGDECDNCGRLLTHDSKVGEAKVDPPPLGFDPGREAALPSAPSEAPLQGFDAGREASVPLTALPSPPSEAPPEEGTSIRCFNCGVRFLFAPHCPTCGLAIAVPP